MKSLDLEICVCDDSHLSFVLMDADGDILITESADLLYYQ